MRNGKTKLSNVRFGRTKIRPTGVSVMRAIRGTNSHRFLGKGSPVANAAASSTDIEYLGVLLDIVLQSESLNEICRRAVLSPATNNTFRGCHIHLLDQTGQLVPEARYGADLPQDHKDLANQALYSLNLQFQPETATQPALVAVPLISGDLPAAVAILVLKPGAKRPYISDSITPLISKLVGHQLAQKSNKSQSIQTFSGTSSVAEMSTRQVKILEFMAEGLTNAEIARKLLLSESTVRQESVRIYRIFNTDNRQEAVALGREAGVIPKLAISG